MRIAGIIGVAIVCGGAALADPLPYDPAILTGCLASEDLPEACVGKAAEACMDALDGAHYGPTVARCSFAETEQWQGLMDGAYTALEEEAAAADDLSQASSRPSDYLRDQRESWDRFRQAAMDFEQSRWAGGSGEGPETARRDLRLVAAYTIWLMRSARQVEDIR